MPQSAPFGMGTAHRIAVGSMEKSITKNSLFYFIYNALNMLFPFITSMYVARILSPAAIGEVAYAQNIVSYFAILAFLGIPTYGLREIAKARNDREELNRLYSELFVINFISTAVFSVIYYALILLYPAFRASLPLYALVGLTVVLNMLNISWLYEGMEEFGYIAKRNAAFKLVMFLLLVLFVRDETDLLPYAAMNVIGVAGNNILNMIYSPKYVTLRPKHLNLKRHLKSIFLLVAVNLAIEIYTLVDTTMLGAMSDKEHVAFYTYASRINKILLQVTNTVTMVLVPRISYVYKQKDFAEFNRLLTRALKAILILSVPMMIGIQFTANFLICQLYGEVFIHSAYVERILCLVLLISPIGYLLGSRVMLVAGHEKNMVYCVAAGAVVNIMGNYFLIQRFDEFGAALASVFSEIVVMILYVYEGRKVYHLEKYSDTLWKVLAAGGLEAAVLLFCHCLMADSWLRLLAELVGAVVIYTGTLWLLDESFIKQYWQRFLSRLGISAAA